MHQVRRVLGLLSLRRHSGGVSTMAKGIMYIDGQRVPFDGETNVLSVIRKAGIGRGRVRRRSRRARHLV